MIHPNFKKNVLLTWEDVKLIRSLYKERKKLLLEAKALKIRLNQIHKEVKKITNVEIAKKMDISYQHVNAICTNNKWYNPDYDPE